MAIKPPQHAVDATPYLVSIFDPAWDEDRVARETEEFFKDAPKEHPVRVYHRGETRFDLDATANVGGAQVTIRDYIGKDATKIKIRRLMPDEYSTARDLLRAVGFHKAFEFACKWGTLAIDGWDLSRNGDGALSSGQMLDLHDATEGDLITEIGSAVMAVSRSLSSAEKKPSAT